MKVAVLYGGISPERNVSIAGGLAVIKALQEIGHEVVPIDPAFGANGKQSIDEIISPSNSISLEDLAKYNSRNIIDCINSELFDGVDVAFIVLHGKYGEDGKIQALLELRGIPYTGSNIKASAIGIDKLASKMLFLAAGISTPPWLTVRPKDYGNYDYFSEIRSELGNYLVIKPNDQGSTIGISVVDDGNLDEINQGVEIANKFSELVIAEQFIEGREITVGIVGGEALPLIEIVPEEGFYDYEHKYTKGKTEYICPAEVTEDIADFMQNQAISAYNILGCSGFARADFRLDEEGQPFLLEMNTIPGFTSTSLVPMAAKEVGIEFPELCDRIIQLVFNKNNNHTDEEKSEEDE